MYFDTPMSGDIIYNLFISLSDIGFLVNLSCQSVEKLMQAKVDGIITIGSFSSRLIKQLRKCNLPIVGYGSSLKKYFPCVFPDYRQMIDQVCSHFYNTGCRKVLFTGAGEDAAFICDELLAYKKEFLEKHDVPDLKIKTSITKKQNIRSILKTHLKKTDKPDAVFLMNWLSIRDAVQVISESKLRIPYDISIVVQGASSLAVITTPLLTAAYHSIPVISRNVVKVLTTLLKEGTTQAEHVITESIFDERGSTKKSI